MRLAVIGAGGVGRAIGTAWRAAGHDVVFGVRDIDRRRDLPGVATIDQATAGAAAVLVAVPGAALANLLDTYAHSLDGHLLVDATNVIGGTTLHQLPLLLARVPRARIFRAFCTVGVEVMTEPVIDGARADLVFCGPDGPDRALVADLVTDVGLRPIHLGGLDAADLVDGVTRLWFALAFRQGLGRHHGIRVLADPGHPS
ncbi:NAD(P)-binding domain-containing protein [Micromonospora sp. NPDC050980]|uniref:NADPH-dependent F420 reductase n=1 Tax=Micromonospora sp. NPDC050980 TaxID=3155161 RepID=UPI0033D63B67